MNKGAIVTINKYIVVIGLLSVAAIFSTLFSFVRLVTGTKSSWRTNMEKEGSMQGTKVECSAVYFRDANGKEFLTVYKDDYTFVILEKENGGTWR